MATTTVTQPAVIPRPRQILRQGLIVTALLVIGVGIGLVLDSGRSGSVEASGLNRSQEAAAARLSGQAAAFDAARGTNAGVERLQGLADSILGAAAAAEHGAFTPMTYRDPSAVQQRFVGGDANLDPDIAVEHGAFTPMTYRDPSAVQQRFVGGDANLDPEVTTGGHSNRENHPTTGRSIGPR
jgi:hypothetical protein